MYDELTRQDLQKMQEEIDYRVQVLRPRLIEDVQTARAFGDLSENFEYKCAKQEKSRNDSRVRYLQRMIKTARVIEDRSRADTAGLYDTVEILMEPPPGQQGKQDPEDPAGDHPAAGRPEGTHQQGVPGGQGSAGETGRRPGPGGHGRRPELLAEDSLHRKGDRRRLHPHRQLLSRRQHPQKSPGPAQSPDPGSIFHRSMHALTFSGPPADPPERTGSRAPANGPRRP